MTYGAYAADELLFETEFENSELSDIEHEYAQFQDLMDPFSAVIKRLSTESKREFTDPVGRRSALDFGGFSARRLV